MDSYAYTYAHAHVRTSTSDRLCFRLEGLMCGLKIVPCDAEWNQQFVLPVRDPQTSQLECTLWDDSDANVSDCSAFRVSHTQRNGLSRCPCFDLLSVRCVNSLISGVWNLLRLWCPRQYFQPFRFSWYAKEQLCEYICGYCSPDDRFC